MSYIFIFINIYIKYIIFIDNIFIFIKYKTQNKVIKLLNKYINAYFNIGLQKNIEIKQNSCNSKDYLICHCIIGGYEHIFEGFGHQSKQTHTDTHTHICTLTHRYRLTDKCLLTYGKFISDNQRFNDIHN